MHQDPVNSPSSVSTRHSRRSTGDTEFFALNLYAEAGTKLEKALRVYKADENHNGIKIDPVPVDKSSAADATPSSVASRKRRTVKIEAVSPSRNPSAKHSKRDSSVSSTVDEEVVPQKRARSKSAGKAAVAKPQHKRATTVGKASTRKQATTVEEQSTVAIVHRRGRSANKKKEGDPSVEKQSTKRKRGSTGDKKGKGKTEDKVARSQSADKVARVKKTENPIDDEREKMAPAPENDEDGKMNEEEEIKMTPARCTRRSTLMANNKRVTVKKEIPTDDEREEETPANVMKDDQEEVIERKPDPKTPSSMRLLHAFEDAKGRLSSSVNEMVRRADLPMTAHNKLVEQLEDVVNWSTKEAKSNYNNVKHNLMMAKNYTKSGETLPDPNPALQDKIASLEAEKKKMNKRLADREKEIEMANKKMEEEREEKYYLQQKIKELQDQLNQNAVVPFDAASSSSSRSSLTDEPGTPARPAYNNQLDFPPPGGLQYDVRNMPQGSAVGHSFMAGPAAGLIYGLGNVAGIENVGASVETMAAIVPGLDNHGNLVQQTIRTTIERIAVPDGMNVAQFQALGYEFTGFTSGDEEDDEMVGNYYGNGENNGPLIEEVE